MAQCVLTRQVAPDAASIGDARRAVCGCATAAGAAEPEHVAVAFSEALTNAVVHAYVDVPRHDIEVTVHVTATMVVVTVADRGRGMQPRPDSPGVGLGLPLIASLTERFEVAERPGGGTSLALWFARA